MSRKDNGGPAFPVADYDHQTFAPSNIEETRRLLSGMSLRDYFAAKSNPDLYAPVDIFYRTYGRNPDVNELAKLIAEIRYIEADAMLAARGDQ